MYNTQTPSSLVQALSNHQQVQTSNQQFQFNRMNTLLSAQKNAQTCNPNMQARSHTMTPRTPFTRSEQPSQKFDRANISRSSSKSVMKQQFIHDIQKDIFKKSKIDKTNAKSTHPSYNQFQEILKDNLTVDVFKSIVVSLDEIIDLKLDQKMEAKLKEIDKTITQNALQQSRKLNMEMDQ